MSISKHVGVSRRGLLRMGGAAGLALTGGLLARAGQQGLLWPDRDPYALWSRVEEPTWPVPLRLVAAATLAASPHNTQPWCFSVKDQEIAVFADSSRHLGAMDACRRELWFGLGCALENLRVAARALGVPTEFKLLPEPSTPELAARIQLGSPRASRRDPLFQALARRHTHRGAYDLGKAVEADALAELRRAQRSPLTRLWLYPRDSAQGKTIAVGTVRATERIVADRSMLQASARWFRHSPREVAVHRDGPSLQTAGLDPFTRTLGALLPRLSPEVSHRAWIDSTRDVHVATGAYFGVIGVRELYDRRATLEAGQLWQRLHLSATALGLVMQPLNQILEVNDRALQLRKASAMAEVTAQVGDSHYPPTFIFRLGHAPAAPASARRRLAEVLV